MLLEKITIWPEPGDNSVTVWCDVCGHQMICHFGLAQYFACVEEARYIVVGVSHTLREDGVRCILRGPGLIETDVQTHGAYYRFRSWLREQGVVDHVAFWLLIEPRKSLS